MHFRVVGINVSQICNGRQGIIIQASPPGSRSLPRQHRHTANRHNDHPTSSLFTPLMECSHVHVQMPRTCVFVNKERPQMDIVSVSILLLLPNTTARADSAAAFFLFSLLLLFSLSPLSAGI
jgi:hypothetical protein